MKLITKGIFIFLTFLEIILKHDKYTFISIILRKYEKKVLIFN